MTGTYTLSQALDKYLIARGVDKKKHFARYLTLIGDVYSDLYKNHLWVTKSVWQVIRGGRDYNYIQVPCDNARILSVSTTDKCGKAVPLYFNSSIVVTPKPKQSTCGCSACDCTGLCEEMNNTTLTTKLLFSLNGVDYFEKKWVRLCKNGDVMEHREVPVKRCLDEEGGGDYNDDFNDDFSIAQPFTNHEIVTKIFEKKICALEVKPCGCPVNTPDNENLVWSHCGEYISPCSPCGRGRCNLYEGDINSKRAGAIKIGECGTRIHILDLKDPATHLLLEYQTNGRDTTAETLVPEYTLMALWTGVDWRSKMFSGAYSQQEKDNALYAHNNAINKLIWFQNPMDLNFVSNLQDAEIKW